MEPIGTGSKITENGPKTLESAPLCDSMDFGHTIQSCWPSLCFTSMRGRSTPPIKRKLNGTTRESSHSPDSTVVLPAK